MSEQQKTGYQSSIDMMMSFRNHTIQFRGMPTQDGQTYLQMMVNPSEQRLCLILSDERRKDTFLLKTKAIQPGIAYIDQCAMFVSRIYDMMGWSKYLNYLLIGHYTNRTGGIAWMFRLDQAECLMVAKDEMPKLPGQAPRDWEKGMVDA